MRSPWNGSRQTALVGGLALALVATMAGCAGDDGTQTESDGTQTEVEGGGDFEAVNLQYANPASEADAQAFDGTVRVWMEEVAELTGGNVTFNSAHGGSLLGLGDMMSGVGDGLSDLGSAQLSTDPATFPTWALAGIHDPEIGTQMSAYDQTMITRILISEQDQLQTELESANLQYIFSIASSPHHLLTKEPLGSLADLEGRTIRTYGSFMPILFQSVGASTVNMPSDELYTAMERAVVDGAYSLPAFFLSSSMGEVAQQLTLVGEGTTPPLNAGYHLTMNLDAWDGLNTDTKRAFLEAGRVAEVEYSRDAVPADEEDAISALETEFDVTVMEMSQSDIDTWSEQFPDVWSEFAADLDGQGLPGTELVDRYLELAAMDTAELEGLYNTVWDERIASVE